ncbi:MAG TPA: hypothetical protein VND19_22915 [Acetobacteraceae bacterium]|nr:hypothetical protein [Acetobacteraceae bacterium]
MPNAASTASAARATAPASDTSSGSAIARTPMAAISDRARSSGSGWMSASATCAPARASARQMPRPMPFAAPVTNAVLPAMSFMSNLHVA